MDCSVDARKKLKKYAMWQLHPLPPPYTLKVACFNFCMWGRVPDVINHAKFQLDRFGVSEPQVAENHYLPLTGVITVITVYALTCYTVMKK